MGLTLLLDLCCGFGSMRVAAERRGWLYAGVDIHPERFPPPEARGARERFLEVNINAVSAEHLLETVSHAFGDGWSRATRVHLHASPPCRFSSDANTKPNIRPEDRDGMLLTVISCLKVAIHLHRRAMLRSMSVENPDAVKSKSMWKHPVLRPLLLHTKVVDYCAYGAPYQKRTRFVVCAEFQARRCRHGRGQHAERVQGQTLQTKFSIPAPLCEAVAAARPGARGLAATVAAARKCVGLAARERLDGDEVAGVKEILTVGMIDETDRDGRASNIMCLVRLAPPFDDEAHDRYLPFSEVGDTAAWDAFETDDAWLEFLRKPGTQRRLAEWDPRFVCREVAVGEGAGAGVSAGMLLPKRIGIGAPPTACAACAARGEGDAHALRAEARALKRENEELEELVAEFRTAAKVLKTMT
eukprot:jgi/Tetstr1/464135/TSEL_008940.t1